MKAQGRLTRGADSQASLYDALESLDKSRSALAGERGQLIETEAAIAELLSEKVKALSEFIAHNGTKLAHAERKVDTTAPQLAKARARAMRIGSAVIPLMPGMMVTAEIKTESRRVIDYLFSPLAKVASEALHEK